MIRFPTTVDEALAAGEVVRAGGTDLSERRRLRIASGPVVDLRDLPGLDAIGPAEGGGTSIGALTKIADVASAPRIRDGYPGLAAAAGGLATPQIRAVGTIGGNVLQRTRCWYYRNPDARCLKKGGSHCYARAGDHLYHSCFDLGACVSVHPSTLAAALLAYDAQAVVHGQPPRAMTELLGDGTDPSRDNALPEGGLLTQILLPAPVAGERAAYFRSIARSRSEWPLVEAVVRLVVEDTTIREATVAIGAVAPVPLRLPKVEAALRGKTAQMATYREAAALAGDGAKPLPMTGYKVGLCEATVLETLERAHHATSTSAPVSVSAPPVPDAPDAPADPPPEVSP